MANNYVIQPLFAVRGSKSYQQIQEDSKTKIFTSEQEAQKFINHLEAAHTAGVESISPKSSTTE